MTRQGWADLSREERDRVGSALHPDGRSRFTRHILSGDRFAHYTSAEAAVKMIAGQRVWMRRANAMNDFAELEYGAARLETARAGRSWTAICAALDAAHPGLAETVTGALPGMLEDARSATFLTALSQHPAEEDDFGRLSMWRAYGGDVGVCLVLNPGVLQRPTEALPVSNHPVFYDDDAAFQRRLLLTAGSMLGEIALLRRISPDGMATLMLDALRSTVLCTKHPGFAEEREWRLIHSPSVRTSQRTPREVLDDRGQAAAGARHHPARRRRGRLGRPGAEDPGGAHHHRADRRPGTDPRGARGDAAGGGRIRPSTGSWCPPSRSGARAATWPRSPPPAS